MRLKNIGTSVQFRKKKKDVQDWNVKGIRFANVFGGILCTEGMKNMINIDQESISIVKYDHNLTSLGGLVCTIISLNNTN